MSRATEIIPPQVIHQHDEEIRRCCGVKSRNTEKQGEPEMNSMDQSHGAWMKQRVVLVELEFMVSSWFSGARPHAV
jgi:hypothetical protein